LVYQCKKVPDPFRTAKRVFWNIWSPPLEGVG
jgi:hypothetical protein